MSVLNLFDRCVTRPPVPPKLDRETDRLLETWGPRAPEMARILAFRAEAGLLNEDPPGFWASVGHAIGHRIGIPDQTDLGNSLLVL